MTTTLAHPEAEDLGRFAEGTLDDAGRAAIVAHVADCDECRIVAVDAAEFAESHVVHSDWRRWVATAAAVIVIALGGTFAWQTLRNPLAPVIEESAHQPSRPVEARLSGFPHVAAKRAMRGAGETDSASDSARAQLEEKANEVLERRGNYPKMQNAKGVARLLKAQVRFVEIGEQLANVAPDERKEAAEAARREYVAEQNAAIALLQSAAVRVPDNAGYQSDLAAALIETREPANLNRALDACDRALHIDSRSPEALFNRAIALRALGDPKKAIVAFRLYLTVDPSSPWANEAKQDIEDLQTGL